MRKSISLVAVNRTFRAILILVVAGVTSACALDAKAQARAMRMGPRLQMLLQQQQQEQQQGRSGPVDPNAPAPPENDGLGPWLRRFHESVPQSAGEFATVNTTALNEAADAIEQWVLLWGRVAAGQPPAEQVNIIGRLLEAKAFVDRELDSVLYTRTRFASLTPENTRHAALQGFLLTASKLIDLSGRLRYDMVDILDDTADRLAEIPQARAKLIEMLTNRQSDIGAIIMAVDLIDAPPSAANPTAGPNNAAQNQAAQLAKLPPRERRMAMRAMMEGANGPGGANGMANRMTGATNAFNSNADPTASPAAALSISQKLKVVQLLAAAGDIDSVADLASVALDENTPPPVLLAAAEAIRKLGLPQDPRPGQSDTVPQPSITAAKLSARLAKVDPDKWNADERKRADELATWLVERNEKGLEGNSYQLGQFAVQPGDWLLMRNPSPYNLFTDLSPGLFTHVGVVTAETGTDGRRRMVVVDLEERGTNIPATNVDAFLDRTLNYVFLRHPDPAVAKKMGEAAAAMIGNPAEFDLNFRTDRIAALKGVPLAGQKIHTYCAGLLLLCAEQTNEAREAFFPITETAAGGYTKANIAKIGLSVGSDFVSPTGALFSPQLQIVGRCQPMYDPQREIEQAVYDHFAELIEHRDLHPTDDFFQAMRLKMAEASKSSPLLATALAASANVSAQTDLVAAAKTAAVVESLDEVATGASREFQEARQSIAEGAPAASTSDDPPTAGQPQLTPEQRAAAEKYRSRHAELASRWDQRQLSPRDLRKELVKYYIQHGCQQLDERFGSGGQ